MGKKIVLREKKEVKVGESMMDEGWVGSMGKESLRKDELMGGLMVGER